MEKLYTRLLSQFSWTVERWYRGTILQGQVRHTDIELAERKSKKERETERDRASEREREQYALVKMYL